MDRLKMYMYGTWEFSIAILVDQKANCKHANLTAMNKQSSITPKIFHLYCNTSTNNPFNTHPFWKYWRLNMVEQLNTLTLNVNLPQFWNSDVFFCKISHPKTPRFAQPAAFFKSLAKLVASNTSPPGWNPTDSQGLKRLTESNPPTRWWLIVAPIYCKCAVPHMSQTTSGPFSHGYEHQTGLNTTTRGLS